MHAVIRAGGKQFRVKKGDVIRMPLMADAVGSNVEFADVLQVSSDDVRHLGTPIVPNAKVQAKVLRHARDRKIVVFTYKRRKGYEKRRGHRQDFTEVRIEDIQI